MAGILHLSNRLGGIENLDHEINGLGIQLSSKMFCTASQQKLLAKIKSIFFLVGCQIGNPGFFETSRKIGCSGKVEGEFASSIV